ncbi:MAG: endolytic transglycosylase MltG [Kurthia gibsonii]|uniref:Endolytic murein transglycosylase n=1 Tax=Kurthia gibsonii TaxID=33946 RepID=A0ABU9LH92_9BACL|nr:MULTISPECIES: endolytic transglycosylase MltG [Kurthia]AMA61787.1 yceG-like family protein [Kurthia sp. 11kri321]MEB6112781.1 endolytic transglycosylase MltG [Kurthia gibsonii]MEB7771482.1 endolytic transglycosylase MltG [Kurthia gibsonii]HZG12824.1 endolytic transglycosylase MltG [Kurthia gibsonii]
MDPKLPDDQLKRLQEQRHEKRIVRKIVMYVGIAIIAIALIGSISSYFYISNALKPVDPDNKKAVKIELPIGSNIDTISQTLEDKGVIRNAKIFKYYTKFKNASGFQAGTYQIPPSMSIDDIIKSLKTGKVYRKADLQITIPEGLTLDQIGNIIAKNTDYTSKEFMKLVTNEKFIKEMKAKYPETVTKDINGKDIRYKLEGYLYPSTYDFFTKKPTLEEIVEKMIAQTDAIVRSYEPQLKELGMTPHEFLTFASLLEREATAQTDRETIASVFNNRIEQGMPLQTDPTVLYALGEHKDRVLYKDLEVKNPYNTYLNKGLPPGPIANAGRASLDATVDPAKTKYLYFVADKDGNNHFAETYSEHQNNVAKYIKSQK